jgi:hypothetical protein
MLHESYGWSDAFPPSQSELGDFVGTETPDE